RGRRRRGRRRCACPEPRAELERVLVSAGRPECESDGMYSQRATTLVRAPRSAVYAALLDARAVATWRVPDDMVARVEEWEPVEGGRFRVSLTYRAEDRTGKTEGAT